MSNALKHKQLGFTLVELVTVIILLGIVGTFSSRFISDNVVLYQTSVNQNERLNDARFVINRMSKELDSTIAFSVTQTPAIAGNTCIQFVPFTAAGQYLNSVLDEPMTLIMDKETRDLDDPNTNDFQGQYMSVLTTDASDFYSVPSDTFAEIDAYIQIPVSGAKSTQADITLLSPLVRDSAVSRYFIAEKKVQYCLTQIGDAMRLSRSEAALTSSVYPLSVLMVDNLSIGSRMSLTNASQFSNAILELNFNFLLRDGSAIKFEHQVVMTNVP
ncbi:type II secretion system protein J [Moritella sp. Urea-trap-13]|uniref:PulJ/GspJ family protein n=1 Tax=Moritella sp. Urea-trap-13 TaxID=2058327 RepID=UPI000C33EAF8|nr:prepilin-type N-terminal cleavage/methylation domain-containing protein [Moritella sp. Urea-trap-13]PKH05143.1 prepilin-type cleavage/methylation domain-containing protein [Moritella sp. Urea-trap-13]